MTLVADNLEALKTHAAMLAGELKAPLLVKLTGRLGAGKTTLVSAILAAWGLEGAASPTFNLRNDYTLPDFRAVHIDFYRLKANDNALDVLPPDEDYSEAIVFVEWPEKVPALVFAPFGRVANIQIDSEGSDTRQITYSAA